MNLSHGGIRMDAPDMAKSLKTQNEYVLRIRGMSAVDEGPTCILVTLPPLELLMYSLSSALDARCTKGAAEVGKCSKMHVHVIYAKPHCTH